jgi:hypothetical protein
VSDALGISAPEIEPLFESENQALERLTSLAQRHTSFADQHNSSVQLIELSNGTTKTIASGVKGQVEHVIVTQTLGVDTKKDQLVNLDFFSWFNGSEPGTLTVNGTVKVDTIALYKILIFGE